MEDVEVMINGSTYSATDEGSGTSWSADHMVSSGEDAETVEFEITSFKDPSGNELSTSETHSSDESGYSVIVDTTSPTVSGVSFSSSNSSSDPDYPSSYLAMEGDTVTLSFTTDERVEDVEVMINGSTYSACLLYTSPSPRDGLLSRMPSSA